MTFDKSSIKRKLKRGKFNVVFSKVTTGKTRKLVCTLNEDLIPKRKQPKGTGTREPNGIIRAFDLEKKEWRSFHVDTVSQVNAIE